MNAPYITNPEEQRIMMNLKRELREREEDLKREKEMREEDKEREDERFKKTIRETRIATITMAVVTVISVIIGVILTNLMK
jgi:hypothetical protein